MMRRFWALRTPPQYCQDDPRPCVHLFCDHDHHLCVQLFCCQDNHHDYQLFCQIFPDDWSWTVSDRDEWSPETDQLMMIFFWFFSGCDDLSWLECSEPLAPGRRFYSKITEMLHLYLSILISLGAPGTTQTHSWTTEDYDGDDDDNEDEDEDPHPWPQQSCSPSSDIPVLRQRSWTRTRDTHIHMIWHNKNSWFESWDICSPMNELMEGVTLHLQTPECLDWGSETRRLHWPLLVSNTLMLESSHWRPLSRDHEHSPTGVSQEQWSTHCPPGSQSRLSSAPGLTHWSPAPIIHSQTNKQDLQGVHKKVPFKYI